MCFRDGNVCYINIHEMSILIFCKNKETTSQMLSTFTYSYQMKVTMFDFGTSLICLHKVLAWAVNPLKTEQTLPHYILEESIFMFIRLYYIDIPTEKWLNYLPFYGV